MELHIPGHTWEIVTFLIELGQLHIPCRTDCVSSSRSVEADNLEQIYGINVSRLTRSRLSPEEELNLGVNKDYEWGVD